MLDAGEDIGDSYAFGQGVLSMSGDGCYPLSMKGKTITLYALAFDAGKKPPVRSLAELKPDSPYVIMFDKKPVMVN